MRRYRIFAWIHIAIIFPCRNFWRNADFSTVVHLNVWEWINGWHTRKYNKQVPICFNCKRQMGTLRLLIAVVGGIHQKRFGLLQILNNLACYIYTACRSMGQRMGYTASVSNDIQSLVFALKIFININFHIVELNFYTI